VKTRPGLQSGRNWRVLALYVLLRQVDMALSVAGIDLSVLDMSGRAEFGHLEVPHGNSTADSNGTGRGPA
jgi:hypothetical protein